MTRTSETPVATEPSTTSTASVASAVEPIRVAVSTVIFSLRRGDDGTPPRVVLPLVKRTRDPHDGLWALPGGWLGEREDLESAASRTLAETTTLTPSYLEQLYAFGAVDRSPSRVVSIVYWALVREDVSLSSEQHNVAWFDQATLPALAFDHNHIVDYALWRLRNKAGYSRIAHGFLPDTFTLAELREVSEAILGRRLDPANFRRQVENSATLIPTDDFRTGNHRPARLYRYDQHVELADRGPLPPR